MGSATSKFDAGIISQAEKLRERAPKASYVPNWTGCFKKRMNRNCGWNGCAIESGPLKHLFRETDELMAIFTTMVAKLRKRGD